MSPERIEDVEIAETIPLFKGIATWTDLETAINEAPILTTSDGRPYRLDNLTNGVDEARGTRFTNLNGITSSEGLRETVACLLIREVANFEELSRLLEKISSIDGSEITYEKDELLRQVQSVINKELSPNSLTRAYGFRETVTRLVNNPS